MNVQLLINPNAGLLKGCQDPADIKEKLQGLKYDPEITIAKTSRGINSFIDRMKKEKPDIVLIAGGDGTIATTIKGLLDTSITFGLIPTGSMNNIGQSIGLGDEIADAVEVINRGHTKDMDVGRVNGHVFLESVGFGLLAEIMDRIGEQDSKKEVLRVATHTLSEMIKTDSYHATLKIDEQDKKIETVWLTVTNTGRAAAALVDPRSDAHDRRFEIVYCEPLENSELARYAISFIRNSHIREEKFHRLRGARVNISLPEKVNVHVDGELFEWDKIAIEVLPAAVKVLAP